MIWDILLLILWIFGVIKVSLRQSNKIMSITERAKVSTRSWDPALPSIKEPDSSDEIHWSVLHHLSKRVLTPDWKPNYAGVCAINEHVPARKAPFVLWLMANIDRRMEGLRAWCGGRMKHFRSYYLASARRDCSSVLWHWRRMGFLPSADVRPPSEWGHHAFRNCCPSILFLHKQVKLFFFFQCTVQFSL